MSEKFMTHLNGIPLQDKELREKVGFDVIPENTTLKDYVDSKIDELDSEMENTDYSKTISKIKIEDGKLVGLTTESIQIEQEQVNGLKTSLSDLNTAITQETKNRETAISDAINDLDFNYINTDSSKIISSITQENGKITTVTTQDISIASSQVNDFEASVKAIKVPNADKADEATKATQDSFGNNIVNTYATKDMLNTYITEHNDDYTNAQIDSLIAENKPEVDSTGGIISGDSGLKLDDIYLKYLKKMTFATPSIASFNLTPSTTHLEVGETFTLTSISHYELNKDSIIGNLTLKRESTTLKSDITTASSTSTVTLSDPDSVTLASDSYVTYTLSGSYKDSEDKSQAVNSSKLIYWYWPHFYGSASTDSLTNISGLSTSSIKSSNFTGELKISNNADQYVYFVTVDDSLTVKSGGFDVPLTKSTLILVINGVSKTYNVYRTNQLNASTLTYVLS